MNPEQSDAFALNIEGVSDLVGNPINKVENSGESPEGASGERYDALKVTMTDEKLLELRNEYEKKYGPYEGKLKARVKKNRESYQGKQPVGSYLTDSDQPIAANMQFEAMETFLSAALAKNPSPVVWADNSEEGNKEADAVKTMLQFHADQLALRKKLSIAVRQWGTDLLGVLVPGWNARIKDVTIDNDKVIDYVFDPDGYVDAYGDFSSWYGKRKKVTAERLVELFPEKETAIKAEVQNNMGTQCTYTEWWPNDDYCFYTFKKIVLDKHKNQYFNYPQPMTNVDGSPFMDETSQQPMMTQPRNHFPYPKKPGVFLSVYSLQEQPHDITSNLEQNIANQNKVTRRTDQIDYNISKANNSDVFSGDNFNEETAKQAANALRKGNPVIVPSGKPMDQAILRLQAPGLPNDAFVDLENAKNDIKSSWGIQGIAAEPADEDTTARGMILNQANDTSRIGGGIGMSVEQVADNCFNWLVQLYYVFYDEPHFAAIMGNAKAVEYQTLMKQSMTRQLIVSVSPDSMKPKDEVTNINLAQALFDKGAIGPKTLLKMVDFPDPDEAAADGVLFRIDPMAYFQLNFPEYAAQLQAQQQQNAMMQAQTAAVGAGMETAEVAANTPPEATTEPQGDMARDPASAALSEVQLPALSPSA